MASHNQQAVFEGKYDMLDAFSKLVSSKEGVTGGGVLSSNKKKKGRELDSQVTSQSPELGQTLRYFEKSKKNSGAQIQAQGLDDLNEVMLDGKRNSRQEIPPEVQQLHYYSLQMGQKNRKLYEKLNKPAAA